MENSKSEEAEPQRREDRKEKRLLFYKTLIIFLSKTSGRA
jgi:hypothetical protein